MSTVIWRKSTYSDSQGNMCVEIARLTNSIGIRDSKNPAGPHLFLSGRAFAQFIHRMRADNPQE
jgi:hypothetical protein